MIFKVILCSFLLYLSFKWFRSVVVITSALHAEGHEFEPRRNLFLYLYRFSMFINKNILYLKSLDLKTDINHYITINM